MSSNRAGCSSPLSGQQKSWCCWNALETPWRETDLFLIFRTIVDSLAQQLGYGLVSIFVSEGDTLRLRAHFGYEHIPTEIPLSRGITGRVARTGQPAWIPDVSQDPDFVEGISGTLSEICVPLWDRGQIAGVLNVESQGHQTRGDWDLRLIAALSEHISIAIARARLYASGTPRRHRRFDRFVQPAPFLCTGRARVSAGALAVAPDFRDHARHRFLQAGP